MARLSTMAAIAARSEEQNAASEAIHAETENPV